MKLHRNVALIILAGATLVALASCGKTSSITSSASAIDQAPLTAPDGVTATYNSGLVVDFLSWTPSSSPRVATYEVYESLLKVIGTLKRIGCLAHSRRKFYQAMRQGDVQAVWFILRPRDLYRIERLTREMTPEERHRLRQEHAPAIWESIRLKAQELKPKLLPKSTLGKAVSYFLSEYCGSVEAFWLGSTMRLEGWISALSPARLR